MTAWTTVCRYDALLADRPVAALVGDRPVAVVRLADGSVHALDGRDPFSGAHVLSRGLVGSRGDVDVLVSPMYKQAFDLRSGGCLDDASVRVGVHRTRVVGGRVQVALQ